MDKAVNDSTLNKMGDMFQYYIALRDCFKMNNGEKLQIETHGDVSVISKSSGNSFQREVKHHIEDKRLSDRDVDFWKTVSNWYVDYNRTKQFDGLILTTTAIISSESSFYNWNEKNKTDKLDILELIGNTQKDREAGFRKYYSKIFEPKNYDKDNFLDIFGVV